MKQLSQAALSVLEAGLSLNDRNVTIKAQLDRKLYTEVNAALEALGGKWNRSAKAHVFAESPEDVLERILLDGGFHDAKQELQQCPRLVWIAEYMAIFASRFAFC